MEELPPDARTGMAARRDALKTEQIIADVDQSVSDVDRSASTFDQTRADRDQEGSNRDRDLSEADQRASDRDQATADREGDLPGTEARGETGDHARHATRTQRAKTTAERTQIAAVRTMTAQARFHVAEQRDAAARSRDVASEARDLAAVARDGLAALYDDTSSSALRKDAADDREHSADDRERAAGDRWETRLDRDELRDALSEAHVDDLTGTLRRALGDPALRSEIERAEVAGQPLVLACLDVDARRSTEAGPGRLVGDDRLLEIIKSLRLHLRSYDTVVRFGNDKFVCALPDTDLRNAQARFSSIEAALVDEGHGASFAVGLVLREPDDTLQTMMVRGEAALYTAKHG